MNNQRNQDRADAHVDNKFKQPAKIRVSTLMRRTVARSHYEMVNGMRKLYLELGDVFYRGVDIISPEQIDFGAYKHPTQLTDVIDTEVDYRHPVVQTIGNKKKKYLPRSYSDGELQALDQAYRETKLEVERIKNSRTSDEGWAYFDREMKNIELLFQAQTIIDEKKQNIETQAGFEHVLCSSVTPQWKKAALDFVSVIGFKMRDVTFYNWVSTNVHTIAQLEHLRWLLQLEPERSAERMKKRIADEGKITSKNDFSVQYKLIMLKACMNSFVSRWDEFLSGGIDEVDKRYHGHWTTQLGIFYGAYDDGIDDDTVRRFLSNWIDSVKTLDAMREHLGDRLRHKQIFDEHEAALSIIMMTQSGEEFAENEGEFDMNFIDDRANRLFRSPDAQDDDDLSYFSSASDDSESSMKEVMLDFMDKLRSILKEQCQSFSKADYKVAERIEAIFWFLIYDWPKASNSKELSAMVVRLVSRLLGIKKFVDAGHWLISLFDLTVKPQSGTEPTKFNYLWLTTVSKEFVTSELYSKIKKFSCALMALAVTGGSKIVLTGNLFDKLWAASKIAVSNGDIVTTVLSFLAWILKSGYRILTGDLKLLDFFTTPSETQMFDARVAKLDYWKAELEAGREDQCTMLSYGIEITTLSNLARELNRTANRSLRLTLANQIRKIDAHWIWFRNKEHEKPLRKAPFAVLLEGGTGTAKSSMLPYLVTMLQHRLKLKVGPEHVYDYNPSDAYMSGFSNLINTIIMDDIANSMPLFEEKSSSQAIIDIINNNKKVAVMADIDSKGQYLIKPEIVMGTTNKEQLNAGNTSNCPISILRRWNFCINVKLKPEYAGPGGVRRDDVIPDLERMDVWLLTVYRWVPEEGSDKPTKEILLVDASFEKVARYLLEAATEYSRKQGNMVHTVTNLKHQALCECGLIKYVCKEHNDTDPRIATGEVVNGNYAVNRIVPNSGYDWSPASALNEVFETKSHRPGMDYLQSKVRVEIIKVSRFVKFMCTIRTVKADIRAKSGWCALIYISFNTAMMLMYFKFLSIMSCGLIIVPAFNILFSFVGLLLYTISVFRRPIFDNVTEAVKSVVTKENGKRALKLAAIVGTILAVYQARKIFYRRKLQPQGGGMSVDYESIAKKKKELEATVQGISNVKDVYKEQFVKPMPINLETKTTSAAQLSEAVQSKLMYARFMATPDGSGRILKCVVFPICSEVIIIPWHLVQSGDMKYVQLMSRSTDHTNASKRFGIDGRWKRIPGTDCALLRSPTIGSQKNIIQWFPEGSVLDDLRNTMQTKNVGCRLIWLKGTKQDDQPGLHITLDKGIEFVNVTCGLVNDVNSHLGLKYWGGSYMSGIPTYDGMCGSPIITDRKSGPMILGVHSAGATGTTTARFCALGQRDIRDTLALFNDDIVPNSIMHEEGDFVAALGFKNTNFEYTTKQCERATSPYVAGQYDILGYTIEPRRNFKSAVTVTMWSEELENCGMPRLHEAPQLMNSFVPWNLWLTNTSEPSMIDAVYLDMAKDDYIHKIITAIEKDKMPQLLEYVKVLPHEVVLAGLDGVKGIDAINRKTSMGIPWCRPKSEFIQPVDEEYPGITAPLGVKKEIMFEIQKMEEKLKEGQRVYVAHRCNLKDEAVKLNKAKVRVFMGSPFPYLYLMRKYFLGVSAFIQANPYLFETAVGINCYGPEWTRLRQYLTRFGDKTLFAGDYKAFDQKMEISITKAAFEVLLVLCKMAGYTEEDMTVCRGLMTETIEGCYNLKGEWIGLFGSNPSGHSLTVVINGIGNAIQMRAPYFALSPVMPAPFHEKVNLITYGDDNVVNVDETIPWYNHTTVAAKFKEWGITYTMADKEQESVPYIDIDECSFLKRRWVYCDERKVYLAPLEHDSISKTMHTYVASKVIDANEQHAELLMSANREYFMYGYEIFEEKRAMLMELARKYNVSHFIPNGALPNRQELDDWVVSAY